MHPPASLPRQLGMLGSMRGMESGQGRMLSLNPISCCARLDMPLAGVSRSVPLTELFGVGISAALRKRQPARGLARFPRRACKGRRPAAYSASRGKQHSCWWWGSPPPLLSPLRHSPALHPPVLFWAMAMAAARRVPRRYTIRHMDQLT